ncbi:hypothetical protein [Sphingomonas sp. 10B4]|uniref:hypothetical protein n=1 Tax=Sphingomonas sp. 10B4 TaxID=3048575 RepID=UPI002AB56DDD|nr:hypothetical protein [Sphingomonas sp. 10B4]MDY7524269.1 hypothetical protein [Sphingomonas sp. 10B4]MEB0282265.1 hypothetical protein [Sphingomonas sp. 10B4]
MADYFSQSVVLPYIPRGDFSPGERLILLAMFEHEEVDGEYYLFAEHGRQDFLAIDVADIREALIDTPADSVAARLLVSSLASAGDATGIIEVDAADVWIDLLQDVLRRSDTLDHISIETAHSCSRMRSDGFGGAAIVITADGIDAMSTSQFIDETLGARLSPPVSTR